MKQTPKIGDYWKATKRWDGLDGICVIRICDQINYYFHGKILEVSGAYGAPQNDYKVGESRHFSCNIFSEARWEPIPKPIFCNICRDQRTRAL